MSKCRLCGKSGLFFRVNSNGLCAECAKKQHSFASNSAQSIHQNISNHDKELSILINAEEEYSSDKDIQKLISVYEDIFIRQKSTLNSQSRWFNLVELYLKAGQNDKAWAWLNQLAIKHPDYMSKIEDKRYKILNKEGRFLDAMLSLMSSIGYSEGNAGPQAYYQAYGRSRFIKLAPALIKKLKWPADDLSLLEDMLSSSIGKKEFNYSLLREKYKEFIASKDS